MASESSGTCAVTSRLVQSRPPAMVTTVAHLKTWKILFTDYRRPLSTFLDSFRAAIGLYFFELSF